MCEERLSPLLSPSETLSEEEASRLGKKDPEQEVQHLSVYPSVCLSLCLSPSLLPVCVCVQVEKFLSANTQELSKDKWLCPLSGKKFKVGSAVCVCVSVCVSPN